jgi:hypothetical protein
MARTKVFVSYSQKDTDWRERLAEHIAVLERQGLVELWSDAQIAAGADWEREIEKALSDAKVAVLLISPAFLKSNFIWSDEMPRIEVHAAQGMDVLPLIVRPCPWRLEQFLSRLQARPTGGRPLSEGGESQIDSDLSTFVYELAAKVGRSPAAAPSPQHSPRGGRSASPNKESTDLTGEWAGVYNRSVAMKLIVLDTEATAFRGRIEYPSDRTITAVHGTVHENWSNDDEIWAQISDGTSATHPLAVIFRETEYERRGSGAVSFDGEYRGLVSGNTMAGAWFSGKRLVGLFTFERSQEQRY